MTLTPDESRVGTTLSARYLIEQRLGAGAVGEVYRAKNLLLGRDVAIKFLRREHVRNEEIRERFLREAQAASHVQHPHVVDVLDVGTDGDTPFIVQELLRGEDLSAHLARKGGKLTPTAAIEIMLPAIDGIAEAHGRGIVHRDLKPENIFLARTPDGAVPKVLDFGISKMPTSNTRATVAGSVFGTPGYMAPEQVMSFATADARADVWSLGVMLYELVSGRLPWDAVEPQGLLIAVCTTAPRPLTEAAPDAPAGLCEVIERCLARDPAKRYHAAAALALALRAHHEAPARTTRLQFVAVSLPPPSLHPPSLADSPVPLVRQRASSAKPKRAPQHTPSGPAAKTKPLVEDAWSLGPEKAPREREITLSGRVSDVAALRPTKRRAKISWPVAAAGLATAALVALAARGMPPHPSPAAPRPTRVALRAHLPAPVPAPAPAPVQPTPVQPAPAPAPAPAPVAAPVVVPPTIAPVVDAATIPAAPTPAVTAAVTAASERPAPRAPTARPRGVRAAADEGPLVAPATAPDTGERPPVATPAELTHAVQRASARNLMQVAECIGRTRRASPDAAGRVSVRLTISPTGRVRDAEPVASDALMPFARCLARATATWTLDRSGGEHDVVLTWPYELVAR